MSKTTIYLKARQSVCITHRKLLVKDLASLYCTDPAKKEAAGKICLYTFPNEKYGRKTCSILHVIEEIKKLDKDVEITSLGEQDIIVYYKMPDKPHYFVDKIKAGAICLTVFFGSAISIMGFNNDVDVVSIFDKIYLATMGTSGSNHNFMYFFYGAGLFIGLVIFFNHTSGKRLSDEPTPVEVQMRMYEKNVNSALIIGSGRKEEELDADA